MRSRLVEPSEMLSKCFVGGTLVEYSYGCAYAREWDRSEITKFPYAKGKFHFMTNGKGRCRINDFTGLSIHESKGVYYIEPLYLTINFAAAPPGVEIPFPHERKLP